MRRNKGRHHLPPDRLDANKMLAAVQRARALKEERKAKRTQPRTDSDQVQEGEHVMEDASSDEATEDIEHSGKHEAELASSVGCNNGSHARVGEDDASSDETPEDAEHSGQRESDSDDAMQEDEELDEANLRRYARLENYATPRLRRKALLEWVTQRVQEVSREDAEEPDNEEKDIRTALMDAIGLASVNVEADLRDVNLSDEFTLSRQASKTSQGSQESLESADATPGGSRIRFADSSVTYLLKPETDVPVPTAGPCWTLDRVVETNVFDSPSAPLSKW